MKTYRTVLLMCCILQLSTLFNANAASATTANECRALGLRSIYLNQPKAENKSSFQYLRLKLIKDAVNTEDIVIQFKPAASQRYIFNEDAKYLRGFGDVSLSSISSDSVNLAINALPLPGKQPESLRLNVQAKNSATLRLTLTDLSAVPKLYDVWLIDKFANDSLDMRQNKTYAFKLDKEDIASYGPDRFLLVIRQNTAYAYRLINFGAVKIRGGHSFIQWNTDNEEDHTHFSVERSNDEGLTYNMIGDVLSNGAGTYSFTDTKPLKGDNIYRLKQKDINNTITYSNIANVVFGDGNNLPGTDNLTIYPNPAVSVINVTINPPKADETLFSIRVMDGSGKIVKDGSSAQTSWQGSIANLQPGTYFIVVLGIKTQSAIGRTRFVKL